MSTNVLRRKTHQNAFLNKQKDVKNETECEEYSVTDEFPSYFNIFECGRDLLNRLDVTYEQACMGNNNPKDKYYTKLLETVIDYNDHHNAPLSNENIRQEISTFMAEADEYSYDYCRHLCT